MTVGELIILLSKYPPTDEIKVRDLEIDYNNIIGIPLFQSITYLSKHENIVYITIET